MLNTLNTLLAIRLTQSDRHDWVGSYTGSSQSILSLLNLIRFVTVTSNDDAMLLRDSTDGLCEFITNIDCK